MDEKDHELLDMAYEILYDLDHNEIKAIAEKYIDGNVRSLDVKEIKILAAYCILNIV